MGSVARKMCLTYSFSWIIPLQETLLYLQYQSQQVQRSCCKLYFRGKSANPQICMSSVSDFETSIVTVKEKQKFANYCLLSKKDQINRFYLMKTSILKNLLAVLDSVSLKVVQVPYHLWMTVFHLWQACHFITVRLKLVLMWMLSHPSGQSRSMCHFCSPVSL